MHKIIVVVGPTGVGKTDLGVIIAKHLDSEIISGDSIQIYKELNIGSAKVTTEEMQGIEHHLIDIKSIYDSYSVMEFQQLARLAIKQIHDKGKIPIIVGGTGLYIKAALYDYEFVEHDDSDKEFVNKHKDKTNEELHEILTKLDEKTSKEIHKNNRKRVLRALFLASQGSIKSEVIEEQEHKPIYDIFMVGCTLERNLLYKRIDSRVLQMLSNGLEEEVIELNNMENIWQQQGMQGIGYKEWKEYFLGNVDKNKVINDIQTHSRQFAKRQYTWFNNQMDVNWYMMDEGSITEEIISNIEKWRKRDVE